MPEYNEAVQVMSLRGRILADVIENIENIQLEEAHAARERAEKLLRTAVSDSEIEQFEKELQMQMIRERLAGIGKIARIRNKEPMKFENRG